MDAGAIIAIVTLALGGLGLFWRASAKTSKDESRVEAVEGKAAEALKRCDTIASHVSRLKVAAARQDERFDNLCERVDEVSKDVKELLQRTAPRD